MACLHPLQALRSSELTSTGKRGIYILGNKIDYSHLKSSPDFLMVPCGQCVGCRLERSRQWAVRCVHESRLYERNCFITLTFSDDVLFSRPNPFSVDVREFQLFMKRLRKRFSGFDPVIVNDEETFPIRFFHCGEYGELYGRPHYHACLFNFDFDDKVLWKYRDGIRLYTSECLSSLWPFGFSTIGDVTFESAAYVARYIMKKVTGDQSFDYYNTVDYSTGEILFSRAPEYTTMSRRPGIGKLWIDKYLSDVYVNGGDSVIMNGRKVRPPKYYDSQLEIVDPSALESIKLERIRKAFQHEADNTPSRLYVREKVQLASLRKLPRNLE